MSSLQDEDGAVDFDQTWTSLFVILEALDLEEVETAVDAEEIDAELVAKIADTLAPHDWGSLFVSGVISSEDLPEPAEIVEPYYRQLRELTMACADEELACASSLY
jgi:hypothetical protein